MYLKYCKLSKKEATKPAGFNLLQRQEKIDHFVAEYNNELLHQSINMKILEKYIFRQLKYTEITRIGISSS
jgi:hypothetical protein